MEQRVAQLQLALQDMGLQPCGPKERVAHLLPKRNVETWLLCLNGESVDEVTDYKTRAEVDSLISPGAEALFIWSRANAIVPSHCVPSLRFALTEIRRVDALPANASSRR